MLSVLRQQLYSHIARLPDSVPANQALRCHVDASIGRPPQRTWRRRPGRPRNSWLEQIRQIPALLQPIYGVGKSYEDTERRYGPGWLRADDDDDDDDEFEFYRCYRYKRCLLHIFRTISVRHP